MEDASGRVGVRGEGASVEAVQVYNERGSTASEGVLAIGMSLLGVGSYERRYKESILAPNIPVFVLGTVLEGGVIGAAPPGARVSRVFELVRQNDASAMFRPGRPATWT